MTWVLPGWDTRSFGRLKPEFLAGCVDGVVEVRLVAADLGDLVQVALVVTGPDLHHEPEHSSAIKDERGVQDRQEHAGPRVGVATSHSG